MWESYMATDSKWGCGQACGLGTWQLWDRSEPDSSPLLDKKEGCPIGAMKCWSPTLQSRKALESLRPGLYLWKEALVFLWMSLTIQTHSAQSTDTSLSRKHF